MIAPAELFKFISVNEDSPSDAAGLNLLALLQTVERAERDGQKLSGFVSRIENFFVHSTLLRLILIQLGNYNAAFSIPYEPRAGVRTQNALARTVTQEQCATM
jgi:hypothetical protein